MIYIDLARQEVNSRHVHTKNFLLEFRFCIRFIFVTPEIHLYSFHFCKMHLYENLNPYWRKIILGRIQYDLTEFDSIQWQKNIP